MLVNRPKVGQRVLVRRWHHGNLFAGREYWEPGVVEVVRRGEAVVRVRRSYELVVPFSELFEMPRHWGKR